MEVTVTDWDSITKGMQVRPAGSAASHSRAISYQPRSCLLQLEMSPSATAGLGGTGCGCHTDSCHPCSLQLHGVAPTMVSLRPFEAAGSSSLEAEMLHHFDIYTGITPSRE